MQNQPLDQAIRENAQGPAEARGDSGSVKQHSLKDQIEADRFLASKRAVKSRTRGVRFTKMAPPGAS
ncbi:hypothetical protein SH661x_004370 [Planctomicrobium sp. SH661]|uniref:hypothetical protein n=1 Tax=Planctomicrobium sp. SH661 TaxID=3448124 RepID=UPI003F5B524A